MLIWEVVERQLVGAVKIVVRGLKLGATIVRVLDSGSGLVEMAISMVLDLLGDWEEDGGAACDGRVGMLESACPPN